MVNWLTPQTTKTQVKKAGKVVAKREAWPDEREAARGIINNFRSAHGFPLNTMQANVRSKADPDQATLNITSFANLTEANTAYAAKEAEVA